MVRLGEARLIGESGAALARCPDLQGLQGVSRINPPKFLTKTAGRSEFTIMTFLEQIASECTYWKTLAVTHSSAE